MSVVSSIPLLRLVKPRYQGRSEGTPRGGRTEACGGSGGGPGYQSPGDDEKEIFEDSILEGNDILGEAFIDGEGSLAQRPPSWWWTRPRCMVKRSPVLPSPRYFLLISYKIYSFI